MNVQPEHENYSDESSVVAVQLLEKKCRRKSDMMKCYSWQSFSSRELTIIAPWGQKRLRRTVNHRWLFSIRLDLLSSFLGVGLDTYRARAFHFVPPSSVVVAEILDGPASYPNRSRHRFSTGLLRHGDLLDRTRAGCGLTATCAIHHLDSLSIVLHLVCSLKH